MVSHMHLIRQDKYLRVQSYNASYLSDREAKLTVMKSLRVSEPVLRLITRNARHGKSISVITSGRQRWLLQQRSNSEATLLKLLPPSREMVG